MRDISRLGLVAVVATLLLRASVFADEPAEPVGAPIPATPPFASPDIKPTLADWVTARPIALAKKIAVSDPLQKPPFVGQSPDSLKGMAAGIRAVQLDVPNRMKAAAYLGTVDCVTYPQAQAMLIATMEEDPSEEVRYEAVMALRMMMSRGCTNMETTCECDTCRSRKSIVRETERHSNKSQRAIIKEAKCCAKFAAIKARKSAIGTRYDCCRGCCNEKVLKALGEVASGKDDHCCWIEPSERVRQAAAEGMRLCCVATLPYSFEPAVEPAPPVNPEPMEVQPNEEKEVTPQPTPEATTTSRTPAPAPKAIATVATSAAPAIAALNGYCIVGLKQRAFNVTSKQLSSVFEEHTYYFASIEAKAEFDANPAQYAPAYGGIDPVVFLERHEMVNGQFLREFEGRFYLFATKESWQTFKTTPERFVLKTAQTSKDLVSN